MLFRSVDEWYKGAFGSLDGTWYKYATGSNNTPLAVSSGINSGTVVFGKSVSSGPAEVTNAGGLSAFGTMAQTGNAFEWTETAYDGVNDTPSEAREARGGGFSSPLEEMDSALRISLPAPGVQLNTEDGFRVASVPEPCALSLLAIGLGGLVILRRRCS